MEMDYYNVLEEVVPTLVSVFLRSPDYQTFCHCDICRRDVIALSLNSIPPRYVTSDEKRNIVVNLFNQSFMRQMVNKHIISAIHVVGKQPNHD